MLLMAKPPVDTTRRLFSIHLRSIVPLIQPICVSTRSLQRGHSPMRTLQDSVQSDNDAHIVKSQDDPVNAWRPSMGIVQEQLTSSPIEEVYALEPEAAPLVESPRRCISTPASRRYHVLYPSLRTPIRSCLRPRSYLHHRVPLLRSRLCNCLPLPITPTTTPRGNQYLA